MINDVLKRRIAEWLENYGAEGFHGRTSHRKAFEMFREIVALPEQTDASQESDILSMDRKAT